MVESDFGSMLKRSREKAGMTQQELADMLFVTQQTVSKWERELSYPDPILMTKLADALGIGWSSLLAAMDTESGDMCRVEMVLDDIVYAVLDALLGSVPSTDEEAERMRQRHAHLMPILFMLGVASSETGHFVYSLPMTRAEAQDFHACAKLAGFNLVEFWNRYVIFNHSKDEMPDWLWSQIDAFDILGKCVGCVLRGDTADVIEYTSEPYAAGMMPDEYAFPRWFTPVLVAEIGLPQRLHEMLPLCDVSA